MTTHSTGEFLERLCDAYAGFEGQGAYPFADRHSKTSLCQDPGAAAELYRKTAQAALARELILASENGYSDRDSQALYWALTQFKTAEAALRSGVASDWTRYCDRLTDQARSMELPKLQRAAKIIAERDES